MKRFEEEAEQARISLEQERERLRSAESLLAEARAASQPPERVRQFEEEVERTRRNIAEEQADLRETRLRAAIAGGVGVLPTPEQLDQLEAGVDQARAAVNQQEAGVDQARAAIRQQEAGVDQARAGVRQQEAGADQARAAVDQARASLDKATVRAPVSGMVLRRLVEPGAVVAPGAAIAELANLGDLFVKVFIPMPQIGLVELGMTVDVLVDTFPDRPFKGEVVHISDRAEFTPRDVVTKEERVTMVVAVKVQLRDGLGGELKPGMSADLVFPAMIEPPCRLGVFGACLYR